MQSNEPFQRVRISSQFSYLRSYTPINNRIRTFSELIEESLGFAEIIMENYPTSNITPNITPNFIQEIIISCCPFDVSEEELYCYICMDIKNDFEICLFTCENNVQTSNCSGHKICQTCLKDHIKTSNLCPLCRKIITKITTQNDEIKQLFTIS